MIKLKRLLKESNDNKLQQIADQVSSKMYCNRFGSCVHFAELFVLAVHKEDPSLLKDFNVIEGYVIDGGRQSGQKLQHTWIVTKSGKEIDPTFIQFNPNSKKHPRIRRKYTGEKYYEDTLEGSWFSNLRKTNPERVFMGQEINETIGTDLLELLIPVVIAIGLWAMDAIPRAIGALVLKIASIISPKVKQQVDMVKDAIESSVTEEGAITRVKAKQIAKDILTDKEMTSLILKAATTTNVKKKEEHLKSFNEYMQTKYPEADRYLKTFIKTYVRQGAAYKSRKNDYKRP